MNKEQKIQMLKDIQDGMLVKFALLRNTIVILVEDINDIYYLEDGTTITKEEKEKYLKSVIVVSSIETRNALIKLTRVNAQEYINEFKKNILI